MGAALMEHSGGLASAVTVDGDTAIMHMPPTAASTDVPEPRTMRSVGTFKHWRVSRDKPEA